METKSDYTRGTENADLVDANTNVTECAIRNVNSDDTPPIYYDSEPSAQPPELPSKQIRFARWTRNGTRVTAQAQKSAWQWRIRKYRCGNPRF